MMRPTNRIGGGRGNAGGGRGRSFEPDAVTWRVLSQVARAEDVDPVDLPPLGDVIDPEALELVFQDESTVERVRFEYCDRTVEVESAGDTTRIEIGDGR